MMKNAPDETYAAVVALGANLASKVGAPMPTLEAALEMLGGAGHSVLRRSRWFSTPAWPSGAGPDYVNGVVVVAAPEGPGALLSALQKIENELGRVRSAAPGERWGPRVCDLDIVCAGDRVTPGCDAWIKIAAAQAGGERPRLVLPHPQMHLRAFVLAPMVDVAPDWIHPVLGVSASELLATLDADERAAARPLD